MAWGGACCSRLFDRYDHLVTDSNVNNNGAADRTPSSVLLRAKNNDRDALNRLATLVGPMIYDWLRQWGLQPNDASDLGQEVLLTLVTKLQSFRKEKETDTFRGWLRRIAHNKFIDFVRRKPMVSGGSDVHRLIAQAAVEPDPAALSDETRLLHRRVVEMIRQECTEDQWKIFSRVVMDGQVAKDVAEELGTTPNAVYLVKSRILRRIRLEFGDLLDQPADE